MNIKPSRCENLIFTMLPITHNIRASPHLPNVKEAIAIIYNQY